MPTVTVRRVNIRGDGTVEFIVPKGVMVAPKNGAVRRILLVQNPDGTLEIEREGEPIRATLKRRPDGTLVAQSSHVPEENPA